LVGGDPEWAHELRRQLVHEIELVSSGLVSTDSEDAADANGRIDDLRRRLEQVERLIEAIEALQWDGAEEAADGEADEADAGSSRIKPRHN
jgi:hypothetical protein